MRELGGLGGGLARVTRDRGECREHPAVANLAAPRPFEVALGTREDVRHRFWVVHAAAEQGLLHSLHHLRIEILLVPERFIQHQSRLPVAKDSEQRKRQLERYLGVLVRVARELERVAQRQELLSHRQHRLGAPELQQDRQAIVLQGWLGQRAAQVGTRCLGRATRQRIARRGAERLHDPDLAVRLG